ncbi:universal stress protein [filamentous cyanobacterium CCP5]|nr:universal stress protein [filamentous cyanobacterium CCP5]
MSLFTTDRVLVPIDFSEEAIAALSKTLESIDDPGQIYALHVLPRLEATDPSVVWETISDESREQNVEKAFKERFGEDFSSVKFEVKFGDPSSEIIDFAKQNEITLIVIPSHGRTGLGRFFLGSVAERVVRFAHCPVLVLRR